MNKYMIITPEGYTEDNDGYDTWNCQVLGRIEANNKSEATYNFRQESKKLDGTPWFSQEKLIAVQLHESEKV